MNYISIKVFLKPIVENIEFRESNDNYKYLKTECKLWRELRYWICKLHILRIIRLHILQGSWGSSAPISLFYRYGNWAAERLHDLLRKLTSERAGSHMISNLSWESMAQLESSRFSFLWGEMRAYLTKWQELKLVREKCMAWTIRWAIVSFRDRVGRNRGCSRADADILFWTWNISRS